MFRLSPLCIACIASMLATTALVAQNDKKATDKETKTVSISGYVQADYQYGEKDASLQVGEPNKDKTESFGRFGIRRGRLKTTADFGPVSVVGTLNVNEKAVTPFNLYIKYAKKASELSQLGYSVVVGLQEVPFGLEVPESSSRRLAPERADYIRYLFPGDIDIMLNGQLSIGWMVGDQKIVFQTNAALLSGNGPNSMRKSIPDGLLRIELRDDADPFCWCIGTSAYLGYVLGGEQSNERMQRRYLDGFAELSFRSLVGTSRLRGEIIVGKQPGQLKRFGVTGAGITPDNYGEAPIIVRDFIGWMGQIEHRINVCQTTKVTPFAKYYYLDRNTKLHGNLLSAAVSNNVANEANDSFSNALGAGIRIDYKQWSLTPYYEWIMNEKVAGGAYAADRADNRFTLRLQCAF